jgi:hypothetical protein
MDPKLTILFIFVAAVVGFSHLTDENLARVRRQLIDRRWRRIVRLSRKT